MKRVAILQSSYLPWKGYFDLIDRADEFIVFDCAQYTKNDWRNRNQIKSPSGKKWLTVPVHHKYLEQSIDEVQIADPRCFRKHWSTFRQCYAKAPCIDYCAELLEPVFEAAQACTTISAVNLLFIDAIKGVLGIETSISNVRDYNLDKGRNERLISLCLQARAGCYLSGPAARSYLDVALFSDHGITVEWMDYANYREYPQPHPPFDHQVSILDLLACTGDKAAGYLKGKAGPDTP